MEVIRCVILYGGVTIETALSIFFANKEMYKVFDNVLLRLNIGYGILGSRPDTPCYVPGRVWVDEYFSFPVWNYNTWYCVVSAMRNVCKLRSEIWNSFTKHTDIDCRPKWRREIHAHEFYTLLIAHGHFGLAKQLAQVTNPTKEHRLYASVLHGGWDKLREESESDDAARAHYIGVHFRNEKTVVPVCCVEQFYKINFWKNGPFNTQSNSATDDLLVFFYDILKRRSDIVLTWFMWEFRSNLIWLPKNALRNLPAVDIAPKLHREAESWGNPQAIEFTETMLRAFKY